MKTLTFTLRLCLILGTGLWLSSCKNENANTNIEVHTVDENMKMPQTLNVAVANNIDPICGMEIPKYLKDTLHFQNDIFGFCSKSCKESFAEDPSKYLDSLKK